jgi:hypothetical protein
MSDQLSGTVRPSWQHGADLGPPGVARGRSAFATGKPDALFTPRSRATRTGLKLTDGLSFESWSRIGQQVSTFADASAWWIGDWLVYGQKAFPGRYRAAVAGTGFSYQTLRNYAWVASQFPLYRRRDTLSFGHHAEVASLPEPDQEMWLLRAVAHRWSRNTLRSRLRSANRCHADCTPIAIALQVEELRHERWRAAAIARGRPLDEWITAVVDEAAAAALLDSESVS